MYKYHLYLIGLFCLIIGCNQQAAIKVSHNVSIDSGSVKIYIPFSYIDTGFSTLYDTGFDDVFLIDSFYNKNKSIVIRIERERARLHAKISRDMVISNLSKGIRGILKDDPNAEIFKADSFRFNDDNSGGLISYINSREQSGLVIFVLHSGHGKWYKINIIYSNKGDGLHFKDSIPIILESIITK
jgi:hypothetical protein